MKLKHVGILAGTVLWVGGCFLNPEDDDNGNRVTESQKYIVATTSLVDQAGNVALISTDDFSASTDLLSIHPDNAVMTNGSSTYILERYGKDNLLRIDGPDISADSLKYQVKIGTAVNIHEIACVSESKAYVTQYGSTECAIIDPRTGEVTGSISLSAAKFRSDGEDVPYMSSIIVIDDNAYIALQRLKV
ncbi:MAG: hypothetical protein GF344_10460, partial [Chitinivibrionales bacterium]|nr:hypothetical protein [Chitinivibrionales bacterium]MBD3357247.1 hypothetical protein [Chitinivibrionales bacterium]